MRSKNVLLAIEAMSGLDEMFAAAASHGYGLRVLAEDPAYYGKTCAEVVKFPTRDHGQVERYIKANCSSIGQIFSATDTWGVLAARLRDVFGFPQFASTSKLEFFRDKDAVQQALVAAGLARASDSWPKIIKPRGGTGKIGVRLAHSEEDFSKLQASSRELLDQYVIQNFYSGPMYSAELWRDPSREIFFGVTNRILSAPPYFTERVKSFPWAAGSPWEDEVKDWMFKLLRALDYDLGLAHVEFIETRSGFELVEINARMAGALITPGVLQATNYNPYAMAVEHALGVPLTIPERRSITCGVSHVSVYAAETGIISKITGLDEVKAYPGDPVWVCSRGVGSEIVELGTYRSRVGNLLATGETASLAQDRAISAAQNISVTMTSSSTHSGTSNQ